jgi:hypothetical protein
LLPSIQQNGGRRSAVAGSVSVNLINDLEILYREISSKLDTMVKIILV